MSEQLDPAIAALFAEWDREVERWTEAESQEWLARLTAALRRVYGRGTAADSPAKLPNQGGVSGARSIS